MKKLVKLTLLLHRYLGFALSLLFVVWFLSGFAMMYVKYPTMRYGERLQHQPVPDFGKVKRTISAALDSAGITDTLRSIRLGMLLDRPIYRIASTKGTYQAIFADDGTLFSGADSANAGVTLKEAVMLTAYDDYYYSKNHDKRLPVLRVKMASEHERWYYVDPATTQVVLKHQDLSRLERWLYHGLHSLDFRFLIYRRPLWDIVMIVLIIGGTFVSATGLVLTWKWIVRLR